MLPELPVWVSIIGYLVLIVFLSWLFQRWILLRTKRKEFSDRNYPREDTDPKLEEAITRSDK